MHPFYEPSRRLLRSQDTRAEGLISMAAYLLFWAAVVPVAIRALKGYSAPSVAPGAGSSSGADSSSSGVGSRRPGRSVDDDPALAVLRMRLARGEVEIDDFLARHDVLQGRRPPGALRG